MKDENLPLERTRSRLGWGKVIVNQDVSGVNDKWIIFFSIFSGSHLQLSLFLHALAKSIGLSNEFENCGPMCQTIEQGSG
jgi:hypothetical protein